MVLTLTLSATTTVKITVVICEDVETTTVVEEAVKDETAGPVESAFVIVTVSTSVEEFPSLSLTVIVKFSWVDPNEKWSASYNLVHL